MAIVVLNEGPEWTRDLYDQIVERVMPGNQPPEGLLAHVAAPRDIGWGVVDVWESEQAFERFMQEKVMPAARDMGAPPFDTEVYEVHNLVMAEAVPH